MVKEVRKVKAIKNVRAQKKGRAAKDQAFKLRPYQVGDLGWVARRHGMLYAEEYGWDQSFEAFVAQIAAKFVLEFKPDWENCWIAHRGDDILGSVFLVRQSKTIAKLRMLYVEPSARGFGIGQALTDACIDFAKAKGYRKITLWTNDILVSARRIYQARGFVLVQEEKHRSFGKNLVGQHWELKLLR